MQRKKVRPPKAAFDEVKSADMQRKEVRPPKAAFDEVKSAENFSKGLQGAEQRTTK